jgi:hypothetical protein
MTDILKLAEGIAKKIGKDARVSLAPDFTLKEVKDALRIVVVPVGVAHRMLSRSHREDQFKVQLGVLRKSTEDELEKLVTDVQKLALSFLHAEIGGAVCTQVEHAPLFVPDHLKERRQFTGIVELTFKEVAK